MDNDEALYPTEYTRSETSAVGNLYSHYAVSERQALDDYMRIIENTDISDDIRHEALKMHNECERRNARNRVLIVCMALGAVILIARMSKQ